MEKRILLIYLTAFSQLTFAQNTHVFKTGLNGNGVHHYGMAALCAASLVLSLHNQFLEKPVADKVFAQAGKVEPNNYQPFGVSVLLADSDKVVSVKDARQMNKCAG